MKLWPSGWDLIISIFCHFPADVRWQAFQFLIIRYCFLMLFDAYWWTCRTYPNNIRYYKYDSAMPYYDSWPFQANSAWSDDVSLRCKMCDCGCSAVVFWKLACLCWLWRSIGQLQSLCDQEACCQHACHETMICERCVDSYSYNIFAGYSK